ncbi:MAG: hypothetical protein P8M53_06180, partial [Pirellulales bacterium]|nr:hypothetical protein [Pirellulales bacterium]
LGKQNWESKIVRKYFNGLSWTRETGMQIQAIAVCLGSVCSYEIAIRANLPQPVRPFLSGPGGPGDLIR